MEELSGSIVPLVTPLLDNYQVDYASLNKLLSWHEQASTQGLIILGSTGEGTLFSLEERGKIIDHVVNVAGTTLPVWVSVTGLNTEEVLTFIKQAADLGADGVMLAGPLYVKPTQRGIISFFSTIADRSELPILLYNQPARTGSSMDVETACVLADHDKIVGIKDSNMSVARMRAYQDINASFNILCGDDPQMLTCLANGGVGVVSVLANLLPELVQTLCLLSEKQIFNKAQALELRWRSFARRLNTISNPSAIKWAMSERGLIEPYVKPPLALLTNQEIEAMKEELVMLTPLFTLTPEPAALD